MGDLTPGPLPNETGPVSWERDDGYVLSTDRARIDVARVHAFLASRSYWAQGIARETVERMVRGSLAFGIYKDGRQIAFGRFVTDMARLAYLMDVYIEPDHRGRGLGTWLATVIQSHPDLRTVARWLLTTVDAHEVYRRAGWEAVSRPDWLMEVRAASDEPGGRGRTHEDT